MSRTKYTNVQKQEIGDRIKRLMDIKKLRPIDIATHCNVSSGMGSNWPNGRAVPQNENLHSLAQLLGVDWRFILHGETDGENHGFSENPEVQIELNEAVGVAEWDDGTPLNRSEVEVPYFENIEMAAGHGGVQFTEYGGQVLRFAKSSLRKAGVPPESAFFVKLRGNSMMPKYEDGGVGGFNKSATKIIDGEEYAIDHGGFGRFKVLYRLSGGKVRIHSYNFEDHPDEIVDESDIVIIGQLFSYQMLKTTG